jgi:3-deoxy-D-manno-octulosonic-acid transferase
LFLANARISDRAYTRYQYFQWFFRRILPHFTAIMAQSDCDAARFRALGAPVNKVSVLGNLKFDVAVTTELKPEISLLKQAWGAARAVFIAASTHADEEQQLLTVWRRIQLAIPGIILLIAPRHSERFTSVYALSAQQGFKTGRRSEPAAINAHCEVVVLDSLGELLSFYALSDYAFVGGSLVPVGGHNVLEPIALGIPVFCGPFMHNAQSIIDELLAAGAIQSIANAELLLNAVLSLHHDTVTRTKQIAKARSLWLANQGAVLRTVSCLGFDVL